MPKFYADIPYRLYQEPAPGDSALSDLGKRSFRLVVDAPDATEAFVVIATTFNEMFADAAKEPDPLKGRFGPSSRRSGRHPD